MDLTFIIDEYFINHLSLSPEDANQLHLRYYKDYGLAISGLVKHHKVDPMEYNQKVDDALPLDDIITPDPQLRKLLEDIDRTKVKLWLFTNAHITHGKRVVKLLGVDDMFEGITYCDYNRVPLVCKPYKEMYDKAENEAKAPSSEECYFVGETLLPKGSQSTHQYNGVTDPLLIDDSHLNCRYAHARGWKTVHKLEPEDLEPATKAAHHQIRALEELRDIFPQFFVTPTGIRANGQSVASQL